MKTIKIFKTIGSLKDMNGNPAKVKGIMTLTEEVTGSKNFHLSVKFDFLDGEGFWEAVNENFHGVESLGSLSRSVLEGKNKNWELDSVKEMGRA